MCAHLWNGDAQEGGPSTTRIAISSLATYPFLLRLLNSTVFQGYSYEYLNAHRFVFLHCGLEFPSAEGKRGRLIHLRRDSLIDVKIVNVAIFPQGSFE